MYRIPSFDPSQVAAVNGIVSGTIATNGINVGEQLMLYNDSPYGMLLMFADKSIDIIPAFWNKDFIINNVPMGNVNWSISYVLNNPTQYGISLVYGTIYEKEERVSSINASMNRGIVVTNQTGIPVNSQSNTLLNRGQAPGTNIINIGSSSNANDTAVLTTDGLFTLLVTIASALVQVIKTNETDPILQLGALTHMVEVLGNFEVDGNTTLTGTTTLSGAVTATNAGNNIAASTVPAGGVAGTVSNASTANNANNASYLNDPGASSTNFSGRLSSTSGKYALDSSGGQTVITANGSTNSVYIGAPGGLTIGTTKIGTSDASQGNILDASGGGPLYMKAPNGGFVFQSPSGTARWSRSQESTFTCSASGTYNHNVGGTPSFITPVVNVSGSATVGSDTWTSSQVHITLGASISTLVKCERF